MTQNDRKKILFLITKSNWGGAQRYVFDLATTLDSVEYEPVVALGGDGELVQKLADAGVRTILIPGLTRDISIATEVRAIISLAKIIHQERPGVLHVNSSKAGALGTFLGRIFRVPRVIFTAHGWAFNEDRSSLQRFIIKSIHWITVLFSHKTIAVSNAVKEQMNWWGAKRKITVINPGRTLTDLKSKNEARGILETKITDSVANLSEYHTDTWIGTIAELHPVKQIHVAIDAIAQIKTTVPDIRYIIIGDGQCREELQQRVRTLNLEQHVFFTGSIHEAAGFLSALDIFVLPSASEAYGYVLLEAGLAHIPIVATNVGGIIDILTDRETGLLIPTNNAEALVEALHIFLTDKMIGQTYADTLLSQMHNHTVLKMTEDTTKLYTKL